MVIAKIVDTIEMIMNNQEIYEEIFKEHVGRLANLDKENKKLMVAFSGVSGSGKTYVAKQIEEKFSGVRINNDDIREIISKKILSKVNLSPEDSQRVLLGYLAFLFEKLLTKNGLLIVDSSIDRKFDLVTEVAKNGGYPLFIVAFNIPRGSLEKRIKERNGEDADMYLTDLDRQIADNRTFRAKNPVDFEINKGTEDEISRLLAEIKNRLDLN